MFGFHLDGMWINVIRGGAINRPLFTEYNQYEEFTGGFEEYAICPVNEGDYGGYAETNLLSLNKKGTSVQIGQSLYIYHNIDATSCIMTKNYIDLRNIDIIEVDCVASYLHSGTIGIADSHENKFNVLAACRVSTTRATHILDVHNINGGYFYMRNRVFNSSLGNNWSTRIYSIHIKRDYSTL